MIYICSMRASGNLLSRLNESRLWLNKTSKLNRAVYGKR